MAKKYSFVPAYYEWHFLDEDGNILLNWVDPMDCFNGNLTDIETVRNECDNFINQRRDNLLLGGQDPFHCNTLECLDKLPGNAAHIMAAALFNYYAVA